MKWALKFIGTEPQMAQITYGNPQLGGKAMVSQLKQHPIGRDAMEAHQAYDQCDGDPLGTLHERMKAVADLAHDAKIYDRTKLHANLVIPGPAIVSEMDSTSVILPDYDAAVDQVGNLIINPKK